MATDLETDGGNASGQILRSSDDAICTGTDELVPFVLTNEDSSAVDDLWEHELSDSSGSSTEATEAWVAYCKHYWGENSSEEEYKNSGTDSTQVGVQSSCHHEPEDWDAEMIAEENPYDEDDVIHTTRRECCNTSNDAQLSENSYLPSLRHAPEFTILHNYCNPEPVLGQFEDADL